MARVAALAEADPQREVCGLVFRLPDGGHEVVAVPNAEAAGRARDGFRMDPAALLAALRAWEARGGVVAAVYHSHVDAPPELSGRDRAELTLDGRPTFPGASLLVVSLRAGHAAEAALHGWDGAAFVAQPFALTRRDR
ncbi:MAG: Mov34/MPN/PAD-1 family protein [Anaeromyxobacteraceae bacterium]